MNKKIKIVFFGAPQIAVPFFDALLTNEKFEILAVVTAPDRPAGRGQQSQSTPVKLRAQAVGLKILQPEKIIYSELISALPCQPDFAVVVAYGALFSKEVLAWPKHGCVNAHFSLLPKYRGASPIESALLNGEKETGISFIRLVKKMDAGEILHQEKIKIELDDDAFTLAQKLTKRGSEILPQILQADLNNEITSQIQNEAQAIYCRKIEKNAGEIQWQQKTAQEIEWQIRAYIIRPTSFIFWRGQQLKIVKAKASDLSISLISGTIFKQENEICVATKKGSVILQEVQLAGKRKMSIKEFIAGHQDFIGDILGKKI